MKIYIILENDNGKKSFSFEDKLLIGRSEKCQLKLDDAQVSSNHCLLVMRGKELCVEDMNSKNGTFINNIRVISSKLCLNDTLKVGGALIRLDPLKNGPEVKDLLRYKGGNNRSIGELTLELDNVDKVRAKSYMAKKQMQEGTYKAKGPQKDFVRNSKLYEGGDTYSPDVVNKRGKLSNILASYMASLVDNILTVFMFLFPLVVYKLFFSEPGDFSVGLLKSTKGLMILSICSIAAIIFRKWNIQNEEGTIGEKIFKL